MWLSFHQVSQTCLRVLAVKIHAPVYPARDPPSPTVGITPSLWKWRLGRGHKLVSEECVCVACKENSVDRGTSINVCVRALHKGRHVTDKSRDKSHMGNMGRRRLGIMHARTPLGCCHVSRCCEHLYKAVECQKSGLYCGANSWGYNRGWGFLSIRLQICLSLHPLSPQHAVQLQAHLQVKGQEGAIPQNMGLQVRLKEVSSVCTAL